MSDREKTFGGVIDEVMSVFARTASGFTPGLSPREIGRVEYVGKGIARVKGLPGARSE